MAYHNDRHSSARRAGAISSQIFENSNRCMLSACCELPEPGTATSTEDGRKRIVISTLRQPEVRMLMGLQQPLSASVQATDSL